MNQRLRQQRKARGWTQAQAAELVGVTQPTWHRWEASGAIPEPPAREKLVEIFGCPLEGLGYETVEAVRVAQ